MEETKPIADQPDAQPATARKRKPLRPAPENKTIQSPENKAIATDRKPYPAAEELAEDAGYRAGAL